MFIKVNEFVRQLDAEGAGAGAGGSGDAASKAPAAGGGADAKGGAPAGSAPAVGGGAEGQAPEAGNRDGIGANSGKSEQDALADLALTDEMRAKMVGALPEAARETGAKWLKTRSSFADLLKAGLGADSKISELNNALKVARKEMGVPETADKYAVYRPEGFEPTEFDTDAEKMYLEAMHAVHAPQAVVDAGMKAYYAVQAQAQRAQEQRAAKMAEAAQEDLRAEFGRDYKANVTLADRWLNENLGPHMGEDWKGLMGLRFADGTALGEKPGFVKAIVALAKAASDDGTLLMPGDMQDGMDVDKEVDKMIAKQGTAEYNTAAFQDRLKNLIAIQNRRKAAA